MSKTSPFTDLVELLCPKALKETTVIPAIKKVPAIFGKLIFKLFIIISIIYCEQKTVYLNTIFSGKWLCIFLFTAKNTTFYANI
jgi:hypothetical protein